MKKIYFIIIFLSITKFTFSQYNIINHNGQSIITCNASFADNDTGNYIPNMNNIITFKSNTPNTGLKFSFSQFDIHNSDTLYVYDGADTLASLIGKYNNSNPLFIVHTGIFNLTNQTGAYLTFRFRTNGIYQANGWNANITCTALCQKIIPQIDTLLTIPSPDNNQFINACLGKSITFSGTALFPENHIIYNQSNTASVFSWKFGDGLSGTGQIVNHTYNILGEYKISLMVTDSIGCESNYNIVAKIRLASNPIAKINQLDKMCSNNAQLLNVGYNINSNVVLEPINFLSKSKNSFDSLMFIPDGPNCPSQVYNTFLTINQYPPGELIQTANDILAICVKIEHSFAGDLGFKIVCPNNQYVQLDPNSHSGGNFLGMPSGGANHHSFDNGCLQVNNPAGVGWSYCWSEYYPNNNTTFDQLSSSSGTGTIMVTGSRTIDSTNQTNHTNYIKPQNPFSSLVGCPLNGIWNIEVIDDYGSDNGYIFHWDIQFQNNPQQQNWSYNVNIDSVNITGPYSTTLNDTMSLIIPGNGGNYNYQVHIKDEFGCVWDTTLHLTVIQKPFVNLGNDTSICDGNKVLLNAGNPGATYNWITPYGTFHNQTLYTSDTIFPQNPFPLFFIASVINKDTNSTFQCSDSDTIIVTINPSPIISFDINPNLPYGCASLTVELFNLSTPGNLTYLWNFGDGTSSTQQNPTHTYNKGIYDLQLTGTTTEGCSSTSTMSDFIIVFPKPHAEFISKPIFATINNETSFISLYPESTQTYSWNFGDGMTDLLGNPKHFYTSLGTFEVTLIITSMYGCMDTVTHNITVLNPGITMDILNNLLYISNITPNTLVSIFDMNGKLIFLKRADEDVIINVSYYSKGIYIVKVANESNIITSKFLKK